MSTKSPWLVVGGIHDWDISSRVMTCHTTETETERTRWYDTSFVRTSRSFLEIERPNQNLPEVDERLWTTSYRRWSTNTGMDATKCAQPRNCQYLFALLFSISPPRCLLTIPTTYAYIPFQYHISSK